MDAEKIFEAWWEKNIPAPTRAKDILYPEVKETARYIATTFLAIGRREGLEASAEIADKKQEAIRVANTYRGKVNAQTEQVLLWIAQISIAIRQRIEGEK